MTVALRSLYFDPDPAPLRNKRDSQSLSTKLSGRMLAHTVAFDIVEVSPAPKTPHLISSCLGRIDRLLLTIPAYVFAANGTGYLTGYKSLLRHLSDRNFIIVTNEGASGDVKKLVQDAGASNVEIVTLSDAVHFSIWAEDGYVSAVDVDTSKTYLLEPFSFTRYGDTLIADAVEDASDIKAFQAPLVFQGGNCLVGDDFWLIGSDYISESVDVINDAQTPIDIGEDRKATAADAIKAFATFVETRRELIPIGTDKKLISNDIPMASAKDGEIYLNFVGGVGSAQPIFHIDMFITLVGRRDGSFKILIGSPKLAADLSGQSFNPVFSMQAAFDDIAKQLSVRGFDVQRSPLPHVGRISPRSYSLQSLRDSIEKSASGAIKAALIELVEELKRLGAEEDTEIKGQDWYFATSNNCLVQTEPGANEVILPTYGYGDWEYLKAVDDANKQLWEELGYSVKQLANFHPFAQALGAVHCIKKYVGRSAPVA